ncbi:MAG: hypothetical protein VYC00_04070, partial [Candidatus Neomarinimicrobiota bacterium]|nr:hypothetical protein [Candidatus Neomarinimicrobiota bacterium]
HGKRIESSRNPEQIRKVIVDTKNSIDEIRERMKNGGTFPPQKTILCNWCYYWEECPVQTGPNLYIS